MTTEKRSAAHITINKPTFEPDPFKSLQHVLDTFASGCNRHEQLILMIEACIGEGINTASQIIGTLKLLGFNAQHIGMALNDLNPIAHRWQRSEDGVYSLAT